MASPIAQTPYPFNHHNPHNKIVNYDPYPPSTSTSGNSTSLSHHINSLGQHQQQHQQRSSAQNSNSDSPPSSEVNSPNRGGGNHQQSQQHQNSNNGNGNGNAGGNDPADVFTWLFSEPVAESIWDDQALEGFLGVADFPLYGTESGFDGVDGNGISFN